MVCALRSRVLAACSGGSVNDESQSAGVEGGAARRRLFSRPVRYGAAFGDMCICSYGCPSEISNLRHARPAGHVVISAKIVQFLYLIGMRSLIFYVFCAGGLPGGGGGQQPLILKFHLGLSRLPHKPKSQKEYSLCYESALDSIGTWLST